MKVTGSVLPERPDLSCWGVNRRLVSITHYTSDLKETYLPEPAMWKVLKETWGVRCLSCVSGDECPYWAALFSQAVTRGPRRPEQRDRDRCRPRKLETHPLSASHRLFEPRQSLHSLSLGLLIDERKVIATIFCTTFHMPGAWNGSTFWSERGQWPLWREREIKPWNEPQFPSLPHHLLDKS